MIVWFYITSNSKTFQLVIYFSSKLHQFELNHCFSKQCQYKYLQFIPSVSTNEKNSCTNDIQSSIHHILRLHRVDTQAQRNCITCNISSHALTKNIHNKNNIICQIRSLITTNYITNINKYGTANSGSICITLIA